MTTSSFVPQHTRPALDLAHLDLARASCERGCPVGDRLLGAMIYGASFPPCAAHCAAPCAEVAMPHLSGSRAQGAAFAWLAPGPFASGHQVGMRYRHNEQILFGAITLSETDFTPTAEASALQLATQAAYDRIFETLRRSEFPYLARCWNYLPHINVDGGGLERYRQFNIGRQDAFIAAHRSFHGGSPAACALGTHEGVLVVYFIASRAHPLNIENPRQVSAYRYPQRYGPRSPTFSRASLLPLPGREVLFISGTASIVGHESVHHGDVVAQTEETVRNLEAVIEQANLKSAHGGFTTKGLSLKVFLRHPEDRATVADVLRRQLGEGLGVTYLLADVCRAELLVEIEAVGFVDSDQT